MLQKVYILCQNYLDKSLKKYSMGGIETYLYNLTRIIIDMGKSPTVIQYASVDARKVVDGVEIIGVDVSEMKHLRQKNKQIHTALTLECEKQPGLLIYATEDLASVKYANKMPSIAIQHGISWDKPSNNNIGTLKYEYIYWRKAIINWIILKRVEGIDRLICVDYNYVNWYRALVAYPKFKYTVIPNFSAIPETRLLRKENDKVKIIFARRFFEYRGTRIFAEAISRLFSEGYDLDITIAGDGPDETWLRSHLPESDRVHYTKYQSHESLEIHSDKNIAVVPTVGSEGTSLSLLEAMASKCAVVCSNVGGLTNIVIDGYNGLMINPVKEDLYAAIKKLVENPDLRNTLSERAFDTVTKSFSHKQWSDKWKSVLSEYLC